MDGSRVNDGILLWQGRAAPRNDKPYCHREPDGTAGAAIHAAYAPDLTGFGSRRGITALRKVTRKLHGVRRRVHSSKRQRSGHRTDYRRLTAAWIASSLRSTQ